MPGQRNDEWRPSLDEASPHGGGARPRLAAHDHGILCTVHAERGVDAVPVVYVVDDDGYVGVPVDRVKPKASSRLQRERNLETDPRATLLVEHWDRDDWSQLWWVRAELRWQGDAAGRAAALAARLARALPAVPRPALRPCAAAARRRRDRLGRRRRLIQRRVRLVQPTEEDGWLKTCSRGDTRSSPEVPAAWAPAWRRRSPRPARRS